MANTALQPSGKTLEAPGLLRMLFETRAPFEVAGLLIAKPWLNRLPAGDGHPVIVYPGLGANDMTTAVLRRFLNRCGYAAYPWCQGLNWGPRPGVLDGCRSRLAQLVRTHGQRASLIGWSLGGLYARELANEQPDNTRCVITLGTPFAGDPQATNAWRLYERASGYSVRDERPLPHYRETPSCPTTSIYSMSDGFVAWQCSINAQAPRAENIRVPASHLGMGFNPLVLFAVADRLAQDPQHWQPFKVDSRARRWLYKV
ncbi:MAG: alpha/beta hydrolase [Rhizobacter sp.]|nr:alpha/beta hydrolase [Rhizobacter sp.]